MERKDMAAIEEKPLARQHRDIQSLIDHYKLMRERSLSWDIGSISMNGTYFPLSLVGKEMLEHVSDAGLGISIG